MSTPASPPGPRINLRGAVDLSGLSRRPQQPAGAPAAGVPSRSPASASTGPDGARDAAAGADGDGSAGSAGGFVVDVRDEDFPSLVQLSSSVPVVVDLWATWCQPCKQLSPILERLAGEYEGRFLLAKVDVDASPQIAAAFQVQSIPTVVAVLGGQPVPLFQGAYPEPQVRQVLEELLRVAESNGITGRVPPGAQAPGADGADGAAGADALEEPPLPPLHQEAYDALDRGDLDAAADAYRRALAEAPADDLARAGLAHVGVLARTGGADPATARAAAAAAPGNVDAQLLVADLDVLSDRVEDAFARLVDLVRSGAPEDRERVRAHLLDLFDVVGPDDPRVTAGRRALAAALF